MFLDLIFLMHVSLGNEKSFGKLVKAWNLNIHGDRFLMNEIKSIINKKKKKKKKFHAD